MVEASKIKNSIFAWLCTLIVTLSLSETCVGENFSYQWNESGKIESSTLEGTREIGFAYQYDASGYTIAANTPNSIVQYNSIGVPLRTGISTDDNTLTLNSSDRIVDVETGIEKDADGIWSFSKTYIYPEEGSAIRKLLGSSRSKATGYSGLDIAYSESTDIAGNTSTGNATLDRSTGITQITSNAPGIASASIATSYYGRLETTLTPGEASMALVDYDPLGRVKQTKNPRHTAYSTILYQANKTLVASTTNANGDTTSYAYNGNGQLGAGAVSQVTLADGTTQHVTYDILGNVTSQYGSQMYPRAYEYDQYNQLTKLHTWKTQPTFPLNPANSAAAGDGNGAQAQTTTWNYEAATGLLLNKRYAPAADGNGGQAISKGTDYLYDTAGRVLTKTLARDTTPGSGTRLQAQYFYTPWGEHKSTIYNDATRNTSNTYDRLGRQTHSIQGTTAGQTTRVISSTYDVNTLLQTAERTRDGIYINDLAKDYLTDTAGSVTYDKTLATNYDNLLRVNGINVPNGTTPDYNLSYGYGNEGRLTSITDQLTSKAFGYNYNPNSRNLIDQLTAPIHNVVNAYEQNRGVLLSKTNTTNSSAVAGVADISKFQYTVNSIGKRTQNILSGKAITDNGAANTTLTWDYTYNDKGELATAAGTSNNAAVATINRTFTFDAIGNRLAITEGATSTSYVSNALNQYQSITKTLADNTTETKTKVHDADGNITNNGTHKYTFDAEDRLTVVKDQSNATLVSYRYDAYSRRIERTVPTNSGSETTQYLYNSWNVIAEYKELSAGNWELTTTRTWGLDISGSEQGAGGIGGLLAENQITSSSTESYYPLYDGNGNITEYLDATGAIVAHYEYDPFGKINLSNGAKAGDFSYQFSTKPLDTTTNLHYYGYRWYDAENGRWINRDPIKEDGGLNVYNAFGGDPINRVDVLGLREETAFEQALFERIIENPKPKDKMTKDQLESIKKVREKIKSLEESDLWSMRVVTLAIHMWFYENKKFDYDEDCPAELGGTTEFDSGDYKCNLFPAIIYGRSWGWSMASEEQKKWEPWKKDRIRGYPISAGGNPPTANAIARKTADIRNFTKVKEIVMGDKLNSSDIIAWPADEGSGHMAIVIDENMIIQASKHTLKFEKYTSVWTRLGKTKKCYTRSYSPHKNAKNSKLFLYLVGPLKFKGNALK